jgi:hypothetical protein
MKWTGERNKNVNVFFCYHSFSSTEGGAYTEMHRETVWKVSCQNIGRNCALEKSRLLLGGRL